MFTELKRKVSIVSITEEGLYHENEMPAGYDGAFLNVEVVHAIMFVDELGNFQTLLCAAPEARNSAGSVTPYKKSDMKLIDAPTGTCYEDSVGGSTYTHFLPEEVKTQMNSKIDSIKSITGNRVIPI